MIETTGIIVIAVLLIAGSAALSKALRVPSPLVLLVVGALIGFLPMLPAVEVPSDVILTGILPPLLYAAALNVPLRDFRRNLNPILGLSVLLVVISALLVGFLVAALLPGIGLAMAIALGAVVAPTDAVAATSIARRLGLPERLVTVLEGESLVNDATALVLLRTATAAAAAGAFSAADVALDFGWAVLGGVLIGGAIGAAATLLRRRMTDPVLTTIVSFAVPFAAFIPAEELGASGVLAVVVAGLVVGHTARRGLSAQQRITERNIWETVQFVLEQGVFLVMGLELFGLVEELENTGGGLRAAVGTGLLVVLLLIVVRTVFVASLLFAQRRLEARRLEREAALPAIQERVDRLDDSDPRVAGRKRRFQRRLDSVGADMRFLRTQGLSRRGGLILSWAGMRGVVTLAAAQTLTGGGLSPSESAFLIMVAFTVAVTTLFGLGGTLGLVIRASGVQRAPDGEREIAELMRRLADASLAALDDPAVLEIDGRPADPEVVDRLRSRYRRPGAAPADDAEAHSTRTQQIVLMQRMRDAAREELLDAQATSDFSSHAIRGAQQLLDIDDARAARRLGG